MQSINSCILIDFSVYFYKTRMKDIFDDSSNNTNMIDFSAYFYDIFLTIVVL